MSSTIATGAHLLLNGRPGDPAVITDETTLTYAELEQAVMDRAATYGPRGVVLLEAGNDLESVIGYLAALAARRPVLLTPPGGDTDELRMRYRAAFDGRVDLHPDLALLLSTDRKSVV